MSRPGAVVLVAFHFPPLSSVGYKRPLRLANYLARGGWSVTVFAGNPRTQPSFSGSDPALIALIHPDIRVIRPRSLHWIEKIAGWLHPLRSHLRPRSETPSGAAKPNSARSRRFPGPFSIPDRFSSWILLALPGLLLECFRRKPDAIFVTGPPWSAFVLAALAGKLSKTPLVLDYRDPWHENPYIRESRLTRRLEHWVVDQASRMTATTASMAALLAQRFSHLKDSTFPVYNGFDAHERQRIQDACAQRKRMDDHFVVSHIGTLYVHRVPPGFARALAKIAAAWAHRRELRFRFVGWIEAGCGLEEAFGRAGAGRFLELQGRMAASEALAEQVAADVLLLLQPGTDIQVPAKLFEYALTGNPILCLAREQSEAARIVNEYGLGTVVGDTNTKSLELALRRLLDEEYRRPGLDRFLADFDGEKLARDMARRIVPDYPFS